MGFAIIDLGIIPEMMLLVVTEHTNTHICMQGEPLIEHTCGCGRPTDRWYFNLASCTLDS